MKTASCYEQYSGLVTCRSCSLRPRCRAIYHGRRAVLVLLLLSVTMAVMSVLLAVNSAAESMWQQSMAVASVSNMNAADSNAVVQYRLDQIEAAIHELRKTDDDMRNSQSDVTKLLLGNLVAVVVALLVYIFTRPSRRG